MAPEMDGLAKTAEGATSPTYESLHDLPDATVAERDHIYVVLVITDKSGRVRAPQPTCGIFDATSRNPA